MIPETQEDISNTTSSSSNSSTIPPDSTILAEENTVDLDADQNLLEEVMYFSLNLTADGKDEDYHPSTPNQKGISDDNSGSSPVHKMPIETPLTSKKGQPKKLKSSPPTRVSSLQKNSNQSSSRRHRKKPQRKINYNLNSSRQLQESFKNPIATTASHGNLRQ